MHRLPRIVPLAASVAAACVIPNPNFDVKEQPQSTTSTSGMQGSTGTGESSGAPTTSGGSTVGATTTEGVGSADGSSGTGADSSTGAAPTTTGAALTTTGDGTTTTGDGTTTDGTTGGPQPMTADLRPYSDEAQCDYPYWCVFNKDVNQPTSGENRNVECFDAPFAPPFTVDRVGFVVFGIKGGPAAKLEFHAYDEGTQKPTGDPFHTVPIGVIDGTGYRDFPLDPPVEIVAQHFCISVHSGEQLGPQLGLALGDLSALPGQTFVNIHGPGECEVATLTDILQLAKAKQTHWCIDATITTSP